MDPPRPDIAANRLGLDDFPRLHEAIEGLGASFITDVLDTTYGEGLRFVTELGIRSSLRTPVVIAGSSELVLAISWQVVVSEPDPATIAVFRRFADQAGLALEQVERREAEANAARRADEMRRLHEVTAALSVASTTLEVSNTCLEKALESVGAYQIESIGIQLFDKIEGDFFSILGLPLLPLLDTLRREGVIEG